MVLLASQAGGVATLRDLYELHHVVRRDTNKFLKNPDQFDRSDNEGIDGSDVHSNSLSVSEELLTERGGERHGLDPCKSVFDTSNVAQLREKEGRQEFWRKQIVFQTSAVPRFSAGCRSVSAKRSCVLGEDTIGSRPGICR